MSHAIELDGVCWRPGKSFALQGLDLRVPRGSIYGFLGPNGSGKTTTIRILMGMVRPDAGTVRILGGRVPRDLAHVLARVGYVDAIDRVRTGWLDDPGVAFGYFAIDRNNGFEEPPPWKLFWGREALVGVQHATTFCVLLDPMETSPLHKEIIEGGSPPPDDVTAPELFGPCWAVVEHGLPGPEVADWLNGLAGVLTAGHRPLDAYWGVRPGMSGVPLVAERSPWVEASLRPTRFLGSPRVERCLAGDEDACSSTLLHPVSSPAYGPPASDFLPLDGHVLHLVPDRVRLPEFPGVVDQALLWTLQQRFGPAAFRRFWRSELPVTEAFENAFGVTPGRYVMQRGVETYGQVQPGPGVRLGGWVGLVLAVAIGVIVGGLVGGRRSLA